MRQRNRRIRKDVTHAHDPIALVRHHEIHYHGLA